MTLGESLQLEGGLANTIQLGWWQVPIRGSPSQFVELGTFQILDQGGSWIKIMSKLERVSRMTFVMSKFLWTFWEKILRFRIIIVDSSRLLQSRWILICCHGSQHISLCATPYGNDVSRMDKRWSRLGDLLCSLNIWRSGDIRPSHVAFKDLNV